MRLQDRTARPEYAAHATPAPPRISAAGRVLVLLGAALIALGSVLPWVVV